MLAKNTSLKLVILLLLWLLLLAFLSRGVVFPSRASQLSPSFQDIVRRPHCLLKPRMFDCVALTHLCRTFFPWDAIHSQFLPLLDIL